MKRSLPLLVVVVLSLASPTLGERIAFTNFDQNHSTIGFTVPILDGMSEVEGKFTAFKIALDYDEADPAKSTVQAEIDARSIDTGIPDRDEDLRSARFFDAANHPAIRFSSTQVARRGADLVVAGTLEIRGIAKPVELVCSLKGPQSDAKTGRLLLGAAATATIDRRDYGLTWEHPVPHFVGDEIRIAIHLISKLTPRAAAAAPPAPRR